MVCTHYTSESLEGMSIMRIIDGVRYRDEDAKARGLTGGREAFMGDRELDITAYAPGHVAKAGSKSSGVLHTGQDEATKTEDTLKPDEAPVETPDQDKGDGAAKTSRRAR